MNLRLMGNRILILPVEEETAHGFIIPEQYRAFRTGIVKAVGNGTRRAHCGGNQAAGDRADGSHYDAGVVSAAQRLRESTNLRPRTAAAAGRRWAAAPRPGPPWAGSSTTRSAA